MPQLYGNPYKYEIRSELNSTKKKLYKEQRDHSETREALRWARAKIEELEAKLQRIADQANAIVADTTKPDPSTVGKRFRENKRKELDQLWAQVDAENRMQ